MDTSRPPEARPGHVHLMTCWQVLFASLCEPAHLAMVPDRGCCPSLTGQGGDTLFCLFRLCCVANVLLCVAADEYYVARGLPDAWMAYMQYHM